MYFTKVLQLGRRTPGRTTALVTLMVGFALIATSCGGNGSGGGVKDIMTQLKAAGLPIGDSVSYTAETDTNHLLGRPNGYIGKINFQDTRLEAKSKNFSTDDGGSIELFPSGSGASDRKKYMEALGKGFPLVSEYDYVKGNVLIRLSRRLTPTQAGEYEKALKHLKGY